jgi:hypothetical protein
VRSRKQEQKCKERESKRNRERKRNTQREKQRETEAQRERETQRAAAAALGAPLWCACVLHALLHVTRPGIEFL